jgi:hypothetical protein
MKEINKAFENISTPEKILALHRELQEEPEISRLNLAGNHIYDPEATAALGQLLRQNQQITNLDLSYNFITSTKKIEALGAALQDTKVTSLDLSYNIIESSETLIALRDLLLKNPQINRLDLVRNDIDSPEKIEALGAALKGTNVNSLNLTSNSIKTPKKIAALRELLRQNPQITSLDLSHTGLPGHELLSLVREFRQLHHVGIDGELPEIAGQLRFNRVLHRVLTIKAVVRTLWRNSPNLHSDLVRPILDLAGVTMGLAPNEAARLIAEATAPAFNFQQGNPNAISFDAAEGGIPRISITFESGDGLSEFTEKNDNTFSMLRELGAIVEDSGRGVEIIAPNTRGGILRGEMVAIRKELTPLWRRLEDSRSDAAPSAGAAAAAPGRTSQLGSAAPLMGLPNLDESNEEKAAAALGRDQQPVGQHARRIAEQKAESQCCRIC